MVGRFVVLLLNGGDKRTQAADIASALDHWKDYKRRMGIK
jgi:putative component of toxin-antitoxin plasmid stabilization module